jgi:hypothetical protein
MTGLISLLIALIASTIFQPVPAQAQQRGTSATQGTTEPRHLSITNKAWTGDFDKMLERRMIRVYAPFSRSLYFNDNGRERGMAAELVRDWERYLNIKYARQLAKRPPDDLHHSSDA